MGLCMRSISLGDRLTRSIERVAAKEHPTSTVLKSPRLLVYVAAGLGAIQALGFANRGEWGGFLFILIWFSAVLLAYMMVARRKSWARITLAVLTVPLGLFLLGNQELKAYCRSQDLFRD